MISLQHTILMVLLSVALGADETPRSWSYSDNSQSNQMYDGDIITAESSNYGQNDTQQYTVDQVIDTILATGRQGRSLDGYDEVYADPNVQEALQRGDDTQARNLIKDKLCSLGLMQCDGEDIQPKRPYGLPPGNLIFTKPPSGRPYVPGPPPPPGVHYGPPKPMPFPVKNSYGPPRKIGYGSKPPGYGLPPSKPFISDSPPFSSPSFTSPSFDGPPQSIGPIYSKPPGPVYEGGHPPYEFSHGEKIHYGNIEKDVPLHRPEKPTIVVNANGGAATTSGGAGAAGASLQQHIHHHYHHLDGNAKTPAVIVNNPIPVPTPLPIGSGIGGGEFTSIGSGGFNPGVGAIGSLNSGYNYKKFESGNSLSGGYNGVNSGLGPVSGISGNGIYGNGIKPVFESAGGLGNQGPNTFGGGSSTVYGSSVSGVYSGGSFQTGKPDYYKKELNLGYGGPNGLSSYGGNKYSQQNYNLGEAYQGFETSRQENFDCVCVPYDQCQAHDVFGRKDDLILPLDPRNLKTDIEALADEGVGTDGKSNSTVARVTKDTKTETSDEDKKTDESKVEEEKPTKKSKRDVSEAEKKQDDVNKDVQPVSRLFILKIN